ncbi:transposase, partial [Streptomyces spectabilis]
MRALGLQRQRLLEDQRRRRGLQCRERTGRPVAHRHCLLGILYVLCNDIAWQLLPLELRFGSGQTCWRRLERWQQAGVFDQLHRILLAEPNAAGRPP